MKPGDRVRIFCSPHVAGAIGRDERSNLTVTLRRGERGHLLTLTPKGWEGAALCEISGRNYLVPYENLELAP